MKNCAGDCWKCSCFVKNRQPVSKDCIISQKDNDHRFLLLLHFHSTETHSSIAPLAVMMAKKLYEMTQKERKILESAFQTKVRL